MNVSELKDEIKLFSNADCFYDYSDGYICDIISEIADNHVGIYYSDIFEWCKHNYEYVEEAIEEGLADTQKPDIPKMIQAGWYLKNERDIYEELDEGILKFCYNHLLNDLGIEEISEEINDKIIDKCTDVDNNDRLDDFTYFIKELFEEETEA